jgi:hypothetical protein
MFGTDPKIPSHIPTTISLHHAWIRMTVRPLNNPNARNQYLIRILGACMLATFAGCAVEDDGRDSNGDTAGGPVGADIGTGDEPDVNDCHTDCFGGLECRDGSMVQIAFGAAPCWAVPQYEGYNVCVTSVEPCAESVCGGMSVACASDEEWVWPGGTPLPRSRLEGFRWGEATWSSGMVWRFLVGEDLRDPSPVFVLELSNCLWQESEEAQGAVRTEHCTFELNRSSGPRLTGRALHRSITTYDGSPIAGSITWWDENRLARLDWIGSRPDPTEVRLAYNPDVSGPVPDWPAPPWEGSGEASEGSGQEEETSPEDGSGETTPEDGSGEGSGTPSEGSGEGSGTPIEGSGEGSGTPIEGSGEGSGTPIEGSGEGSGTPIEGSGGGVP